MNVEDRIWNVSVRSQNDQHVEAANVKEDGGSLIFTGTQGDLAGKFYLSEVQGYSVEPEPSAEAVQINIEDRLG